MKKQLLLLTALPAIMLASCAGSDAYRGAWNATDMDGARTVLTFDAKSFALKDSLGHAQQYGYTQNSVKIENSIRTYGINLSDGRHYLITFPVAKDETVALLEDEQQHPLYVLCRNGYKTYQEVYQLK